MWDTYELRGLGPSARLGLLGAWQASGGRGGLTLLATSLVGAWPARTPPPGSPWRPAGRMGQPPPPPRAGTSSRPEAVYEDPRDGSLKPCGRRFLGWRLVPVSRQRGHPPGLAAGVRSRGRVPVGRRKPVTIPFPVAGRATCMPSGRPCTMDRGPVQPGAPAPVAPSPSASPGARRRPPAPPSALLRAAAAAGRGADPAVALRVHQEQPQFFTFDGPVERAAETRGSGARQSPGALPRDVAVEVRAAERREPRQRCLAVARAIAGFQVLNAHREPDGQRAAMTSTAEKTLQRSQPGQPRPWAAQPAADHQARSRPLLLALHVQRRGQEPRAACWRFTSAVLEDGALVPCADVGASPVFGKPLLRQAVAQELARRVADFGWRGRAEEKTASWCWTDRSVAAKAADELHAPAGRSAPPRPHNARLRAAQRRGRRRSRARAAERFPRRRRRMSCAGLPESCAQPAHTPGPPALAVGASRPSPFLLLDKRGTWSTKPGTRWPGGLFPRAPAPEAVGRAAQLLPRGRREVRLSNGCSRWWPRVSSSCSAGAPGHGGSRAPQDIAVAGLGGGSGLLWPVRPESGSAAACHRLTLGPGWGAAGQF